MSVVFAHGFNHDTPLYASLRELQAVSSNLRRAYQSAAAREVHVTAETQASRRGNLAPWGAQETDSGLIYYGWEKVEMSFEISEDHDPPPDGLEGETSQHAEN